MANPQRQTRNQVKRLSAETNQANNTQNNLINQHSDALVRQTSSILSIVAGTPDAIAELRTGMAAQAATQSAESRALRGGLDAVSKHMEALSFSVGTAWTGTRRQMVAMGRMVGRMGALVRDVRELFVL